MESQKKKVGEPRPPKVIKRIAPGMQLEGQVRSVTDFGAFVDIGVGRDGLVHVSEIARRAISKPQEVLKEGDKVTVWIKDLDRERNRIGLTMIDPGAPTMGDLRPGSIVRGQVTRVERYGAFVDIGVERDALLHVKEMSDDPNARPESIVHVGDAVEVTITSIDPQRKRIDVSMRSEDDLAVEELPLPDEGVEEDSPTLMQLAMEQALARQQKDEGRRRKRRKQKGGGRDDEMEDIIRRTLESHQSS